MVLGGQPWLRKDDIKAFGLAVPTAQVRAVTCLVEVSPCLTSMRLQCLSLAGRTLFSFEGEHAGKSVKWLLKQVVEHDNDTDVISVTGAEPEVLDGLYRPAGTFNGDLFYKHAAADASILYDKAAACWKLQASTGLDEPASYQCPHSDAAAAAAARLQGGSWARQLDSHSCEVKLGVSYRLIDSGGNIWPEDTMLTDVDGYEAAQGKALETLARELGFHVDAVSPRALQLPGSNPFVYHSEVDALILQSRIPEKRCQKRRTPSPDFFEQYGL